MRDTDCTFGCHNLPLAMNCPGAVDSGILDSSFEASDYSGVIFLDLGPSVHCAFCTLIRRHSRHLIPFGLIQLLAVEDSRQNELLGLVHGLGVFEALHCYRACYRASCR